MIRKQFRKKLLKEFGSLYTIGHYPTSDEADSIPVVSEKNEYGCMIEMSDGTVVDLTITRLTEDMILGSFHKDGYNAEIFDLDASKSHNTYWNKFKKKMEEKYDQQILDNAKAKKRFENYLQRVFV